MQPKTKLILKWVKYNSPFLITYFGASIYLSIKFGSIYFSRCENIAIGLLSMIIAPYLGYIVHVFSHMYNYKDVFNKALPFTLFPLSQTLNMFSYILDFHDKIHHNKNINKKIHYIFLEALQNFMFQAGNLAIFNMLILENSLNNYVIMLWGFVYLTLHLINFQFVLHETHELHHENKFTNYEPYIFDIIHNTTNENLNTMETLNHGAINITVFVILIVFTKKKLYKQK